ncbi:ubiquitin-related modifier 1 [Diorhabda carinulata]|uniref:ubiquitin-related modifier 1 n=1 Tax=Diorhabda sublineata TaxID=1163346 RepID=UPI0024E08EAD|nr:ubiquitin-related modifier 1 [Diorhabda sublineata]XP_057668751.1 ubiquitin-related modifier 1 [Diorhabda carinulata]
MEITLEFSGGAELLFGNKKTHNVTLPQKENDWSLGDLLIWITDNLLVEKPEMFLQEKSVRPGILVLINDIDWELMNTVNYKIQAKDKILFISTLHGG